MIWGEPTWFALHTISYKIKVEYFSIIKTELLNIIFLICSNLPCPTCATHANQYLTSINFNAIQTKEQLIDMLFHFHNIINKQKGFPIFSKEECSAKYIKANTVNILHNFIHYYKDTSFNVNMISEKLHRNRIIILIKDWFNKHINYFEP